MTAAKKKKTILWIIIGILIAAIIGVSAYFAYAFSPRSMNIDWDAVQPSNTNVALLSADDQRNVTGAPALVKLNADGTIDPSDWKVLQFTDMHLSHEMKSTNDTIKRFIETLNKEKPDFVVLTGDIVTRLGGKIRLKQLSDIFERAGIYWAYVLGNHEGDSDPYTVSRENTMKIVSKYDHCLTDVTVKKTKSGEDVWGYCNFVVNLLGDDYNIVQTMIFMDSGNKIADTDAEKYGVREGGYDFLKESQMRWCEEQIAAATALNANVKSMLFFHIPLAEYNNLLLVKLADVEAGKVVFLADHPDYLEKADDDTREQIKNRTIRVIPTDYKKIEGSDVVVNGEKIGYFVLKEGWNVVGDTRSFESPCSSDYNNGMYARMAAIRDHVNGIFCGHDHINNTILYEDASSPIYLCYGTCSGMQGYSKKRDGLSDGEPYEDRGYSVIEIHGDGMFDFSDVLYETNGAPILRIADGIPVE